jgi:hypothetical protein
MKKTLLTAAIALGSLTFIGGTSFARVSDYCFHHPKKAECRQDRYRHHDDNHWWDHHDEHPQEHANWEHRDEHHGEWNGQHHAD